MGGTDTGISDLRFGWGGGHRFSIVMTCSPTCNPRSQVDGHTAENPRLGFGTALAMGPDHGSSCAPLSFSSWGKRRLFVLYANFHVQVDIWAIRSRFK
jgi:hypothetical protein